MSTETTTVTIGEATTVTVSANTGPRGPAGADGAGGGVTDGDKGDITVSGSGATWTIDDNSVTLAKLADIATASIIGRTTAATGDPEVLTATQVRALLNVEDGATADQSAAEILTAIKTVDGTGSGLDADTVDGVEAAALAPLASPTFTGVPAAPTATAGANSTQIATTAYVDNATSAAVPKSLVDAKGDLLAASAADTVARLPVGTDTYVLTADSAEALGVKWAAPAGAAGYPRNFAKPATLAPYHVPPGSASSTSLGLNTAHFFPLFIAESTTVASISVSISVAAGAGGRLRLGLASTDANGLPSALVVDAGDVDAAASSGDRTISGLALALSPGTYWTVVCAQVAGTPQLRSRNQTIFGVRGISVFNALTQQSAGYSQNGLSGAFPSTFTPNAGISNAVVATLEFS